MTKVFEIFNAVDGKTQGYRVGETRAKETIARFDRVNIPGYVVDYLPAKDGFFVVDMRDNVKAGPFEDKRAAQNKADMENMASDANSFHVVENRI